jgi:hypothetical protein
MKKLSIAFISIALVMMSGMSRASNTPPAQGRCILTEATAPTIRGLKLGMTTYQLLAVFPGITKRIEMKEAIDKAKSVSSVEAVQLAFDPATDGDAQQFVGVDSVAAAVAGGRVVEFGLQYSGATWRTVDEWIAKLSEALKLPDSRDWGTGSNENPNKVLRCDGVEIEAAIQGGGASIRVTNSGYFKAFAEQGKAAEEKKRRDVKP